ncbi:MAG: hypothetical protein KF764_00420 [Labilithrix sp.]|nr:hypothetical protein [Labilithrix sp.]
MSLDRTGTAAVLARTIGSATLAALVALACGGASEGLPAPSEEVPSGSTPPSSGTPSSPAAEAPSTPAAPTSSPTAPPPPPPAAAITAADCFNDLSGSVPGPDYDKFGPTIAKSCAGTHHQTIAGVEKVVFLGDSVTVGTPPTLPKDFYKKRLEDTLKQKFGAGLEIASCAKWGARTDDLLEGGKQIEACFPSGVENKKTLVVMTNGGNDIHAWAKSKLGTTAAIAEADAALLRLQTAVEWLKSPAHFPNGSFVVFANVYEYTDTSGDLSSCPTASLAGMSGSWPEGRPAVVHFEEGFMKVAVDTKTDMMFLLEHFCGRGFKRKDASLQCYRGANAPLWFDATCIHPTPDGHAQIALQFAKVIDGT